MELNNFEEHVADKNDLSYGLFHGNAGKCLFFHHAEQRVKQPLLKEKAEEAFKFTYDNLKNIQSINFENGLAGIGWAIEYLRQNGFVKPIKMQIVQMGVFHWEVTEDPRGVVRTGGRQIL